MQGPASQPLRTVQLRQILTGSSRPVPYADLRVLEKGACEPRCGAEVGRGAPKGTLLSTYGYSLNHKLIEVLIACLASHTKYHLFFPLAVVGLLCVSVQPLRWYMGSH